MNKFPTPNYNTREGRNEFVIKLIKSTFPDTTTILNIGGGQKRYLKNSGYKVTEIDKEGDNDYNLNLDEIEKLPLENGSFDTVLALDVLEHLENFHLIFKEIIRVSRKNIIISLPNSLQNIFAIVANSLQKDPKNNGYYNKFYGLPLEKPIDRHRWFLTVNDIKRFFEEKSKENNFEVRFLTPLSKSFKAKILSIFLNSRLKKEVLTKYCWVLIQKK